MTVRFVHLWALEFRLLVKQVLVGLIGPLLPWGQPSVLLRRAVEALGVTAGSLRCGRRVVPEEDGESRDAVDGPTQRGDLGQPLSAEVVVQSQTQCVEGLVVVQDSFTLTDVGRYPTGFRAHWPTPLLPSHLGGSLALAKG